MFKGLTIPQFATLPHGNLMAQDLPSLSWDNAVHFLMSLWNLQLVSVDGNPITIKKIIFSFIILIFGILISKIVTKSISFRFFSKFHLDLSAKHAIESFTFYIFILFFVFFALKVSNIPLTVFNLIGGALAIGIGFGSQNIVSNFISGIILMLERPIKIGDFIKIDDAFGRIDNIGMRSTIIVSTGNRHIIVPNSKLLENRVDNWTLNDKLIRSVMKVGVAYGSPVDRVTAILTECTKATKNVIIEKEILVLFENFGDNSLEFEAHFYIRINDHMDEKRARSEIRQRVESRFNDEGIVVAFPQRDVHLYNSKPISVQVVDKTP